MTSQGSTAWLLQRISGVLLFVTLGAHFFIYHYFMGPGMWGFDSIGFGANDLETLKSMAESDPTQAKFYALAAMFATPIWKVFDVSFITLASYHGFYGIQSMIDDWITHSGWRSLSNWTVALVGFIVWALGLVAVISFNPEHF